MSYPKEYSMSKPPARIAINREPIDLIKLIKLDNVVSGGGEARLLITEGRVQLNGEAETRKRKKVYAGDVVTYLDRVIQVVLDTPPEQGSEE
jgi:ribosome-associated protein